MTALMLLTWVTLAAEPSPTLLASLERTVCFGTCPAYRVRVFTDGRVEWVADRFVKVRGRATKTLTPAQLANLERLFKDINFLKLGDGFDCYERTDNSSAKTTFSDGSITKTINHYHGCQSKKGVEKLTALEKKFDEVVDTARWIGSGDERGR
jgi:hypothetical protein